MSYIALGDRWLNDLPQNMPNPNVMVESFFNPEKRNEMETFHLEQYTDENTSMATYVWLPISFGPDSGIYKGTKQEVQMQKSPSKKIFYFHLVNNRV